MRGCFIGRSGSGDGELPVIHPRLSCVALPAALEAGRWISDSGTKFGCPSIGRSGSGDGVPRTIHPRFFDRGLSVRAARGVWVIDDATSVSGGRSSSSSSSESAISITSPTLPPSFLALTNALRFSALFFSFLFGALRRTVLVRGSRILESKLATEGVVGILALAIGAGYRCRLKWCGCLLPKSTPEKIPTLDSCNLTCQSYGPCGSTVPNQRPVVVSFSVCHNRLQVGVPGLSSHPHTISNGWP